MATNFESDKAVARWCGTEKEPGRRTRAESHAISFVSESDEDYS
jgi:hypothetical protein